MEWSDISNAFAGASGTLTDISTAVVQASGQYRQVYDATTGTWGGVSGSVPPPTVGIPVGTNDPVMDGGAMAWIMENKGLVFGGAAALLVAIIAAVKLGGK